MSLRVKPSSVFTWKRDKSCFLPTFICSKIEKLPIEQLVSKHWPGRQHCSLSTLTKNSAIWDYFVHHLVLNMNEYVGDD